jgi:cytochrome P450
VSTSVSETPSQQLSMRGEREYPFSLTPEMIEIQAQAPATRVLCPTGITAWLVSRYSEARDVLSSPDRFGSMPGNASHVSTGFNLDAPVMEGDFARMDGKEYLRFRRAFGSELSHTKRLREMEPIAQEAMDDLLDSLSLREGPIDFYRELATPLTVRVIAKIFDLPDSDIPVLHKAVNSMIRTDASFEEVSSAGAPLFEVLQRLVTKKVNEPGDDVISQAKERGEETGQPFTETELAVAALTVLLGGYETTAGIPCIGLLALLARPEQMRRLTENLEMVDTAVSELVRFVASGLTGFMRQALRDTDIGGVKIRKGEYVVVAVQAANRDKDFLPDADVLDIGRTSAHVGFGHGPHTCLVQHVALVEMRVLIGTIARRVPSIRLAVPFSALAYRQKSIFPGPEAVPVLWDAILPRTGK